jgi:hypothetical protein
VIGGAAVIAGIAMSSLPALRGRTVRSSLATAA